MKKLVAILLSAAALGLSSCSHDNAQATARQSAAKASGAASDRRFAINSTALQQDFNTWWNYTYYNVKLSEDFVGLDVDSTIIKKADFLARLTSGSVVPFKTMVLDGVSYYKLYPINDAQPSIKSTIMQRAADEIGHFKREGQSLPAYRFTDITGRTYTPASTKGKVVVIKCWYIGCVACVQEFPEVNKLVDAYKDRSDILFISLAFDAKEDLVDFLKKKPLSYATVPRMREFMLQQLNITAYPTHILLDRAGKIVKVVNTVDELKPFLAQQAATASL